VYDNVNRLTSRQFGGTGQTSLRVDPGYSNRNELTSLTRYSDVGGSSVVGTTVYSYDDSSRVTSIVNKNASAATLSYYNYGYDNADRVTSETWQSGSTPGSRTYNYDSTSQLTNDGTTTYTYDLMGNRTAVNTQVYQPPTDNRVTNDGTFTYTYDQEGNLTQKTKGTGLETWFYTYDNRNHLTSVRQTSDGNTNQLLVTYTYDVFGQRATEAKWTSQSGTTTTTRFAYDVYQVWAELNTSNVVQTRYVFGDGQTQLFARIDTGAGVRWELTDRLGSIRDVLDATGATILDHLDYDGFGKLSEANATYGGRYTFTADAYDRDTGLAHTPNREYAVATGQWTSEDPIVFGAGDPNLRRYVGNNSTNGTDPSGLIAFPQSLLLYIPRDIYVKDGRTGKIFVYSLPPALEYPALTGEAVTPATPGKWGAFEYPIKWAVSQPPGKNGGVIIQHVVISVEIDGKLLPGKGRDYWEAWEVKQKGDKAQVIYPDLSYLKEYGVSQQKIDDLKDKAHDVFVSGPQGVGRDGKVIFRGYAYYFPKLPRRGLDAYGFRERGEKGSVSPAGALPSMATKGNEENIAALLRLDHYYPVFHLAVATWEAARNGHTYLSVSPYADFPAVPGGPRQLDHEESTELILGGKP
jgi:RHS repeat-associated protein